MDVPPMGICSLFKETPSPNHDSTLQHQVPPRDNNTLRYHMLFGGLFLIISLIAPDLFTVNLHDFRQQSQATLISFVP